jgi:serine/threonine protein kinase
MKSSNEIIYKFEPLWGAWKIEEFVGEGNFGKVYKVGREEWGQKYISAVKLISIPQTANDYKEAQTIGIDSGSMESYFEDFVKNIVSEIELMYKLKGNSNIVSYEDHMIVKKEEEIGWYILIKMEFVQSLPDYISSNEVNISDVVRLGIDICKALETCEKFNIIHRDIKDDNIFVSKNGNFKLGDFGIAKELSKSGKTASMRGTPLYMAPEVYKGESYDSTVDTYSLGIVLYKLLNKGRLPFMPPYPKNITYNDTENSIESRMRGETPKLPVDTEDALGELILKSINYDPSKRFQSPKEMRKALEKAIGMLEEQVNDVKLADVDIEKAVDINGNSDTKGSMFNKSIDTSITQRDSGKYSKTVSILEAHVDDVKLAEVDEEKAADINENSDAKESMLNKSIDTSIIQRNSGKHSKTVSIFDNDPKSCTKDNVETAAIFKNVKKNNNERGGRVANPKDIDSYTEEDNGIEDINREIKEDLDAIGKRISKSSPKKKSSKIINILPYIVILLVVISSGIVLMNSVGNKGLEVNKKTAVNKEKSNIEEEKISYYEEAQQLYDEGKYNEALDLITMELEQTPDNAAAIRLQIDTKNKLSQILLQKGMAFLKENKLKEAQASFEAAVIMYKPNAEAQKQLDKVNKLINNKK